jgi:hypothetical protein
MSEEPNLPRKKPSLVFRLVKAVGILVALVAVEMVGASMLIPSAEETEKLARELASAANGEDSTPLDGAAPDIEESVVTKEVELLTDNITRFNPNTDTTLNVQFSIYGVVLATEEAEFLAEFATSSNRIHEQIMLTIHGADSADLANAGLGLIKRQILEKTNRTLGRPMLREVVFTKLNFVER